MDDYLENELLRGEKAVLEGDIEGSIQVFSRLLQKYDDSRVLNNLAIAYWESDQRLKALEMLNRAIELDANDEVAKENLTAILRAIKADNNNALGLVNQGGYLAKSEQPRSEITNGSVSSKSILDYSGNFYGNVILNPSTLAEIAYSVDTWNELIGFHFALITDVYTEYLHMFYTESITRFGPQWRYMDIISVLYSASKTVAPKNYLEIGVRRGRSLLSVIQGCPTVNAVAFDMWIQNYAGMDNPGPEYVQEQANKLGHLGTIEFINGDSHQTVPQYFSKVPDKTFDIITVDGDHSEEGAYADLKTVIPRLALGGILVFDDISHPAHPYLGKVWRRIIAEHPFLRSYEYTEMGYGVGFAIRVE